MPDMDAAERIRLLEAENARLRRLLDQNNVPSALRHQVRNALGLMRAILRRSAAGKTSVDDFSAHVEGRFDALLRVQTMLISSPDGAADLYALAANELMAQTVRDGETASLQGPPLRLDGRRAELLGLVIHELAMNAIKFGALTVPSGRIDLTWRLEGEPRRLVLTWTEMGPVRTDMMPAFRGFGTEAIEGMLPYQLKASSHIEFLPKGVRCTIVLPLSPDGAGAAA